MEVEDILLTQKKSDKSDIETYRSISIFPTPSKIFERCMYDQMSKYFDQILSKYQNGLRQGYNIQLCLLMMVEKWRENSVFIYAVGLGDALLTDLSKACDCIKCDLLRVKLAAYGFDSYSLSFLFSYLNKRKQEQKYITFTAYTLK